MAIRARKVSAVFMKRAPGVDISSSLNGSTRTAQNDNCSRLIRVKGLPFGIHDHCSVFSPCL